MVNILSANTEVIGGKTLGQMLIQLPEDTAAQDRIKHYLERRGIFFEANTGAGGEDAGLKEVI